MNGAAIVGSRRSVSALPDPDTAPNDWGSSRIRLAGFRGRLQCVGEAGTLTNTTAPAGRAERDGSFPNG